MAAHRYWRIYIDSFQPGTGTNVTLFNIAMASSNGGTNLVVGSAVPYGATHASGSSLGSDLTAPNCWEGADETAPCWWAYDFGSPVAIVEVSFLCTPANGWGDGPAAWDMQYSDDNVGWTTLASWVPADWNVTPSQTFEIAQGVLSVYPSPYTSGAVHLLDIAVGNAGVTVPFMFNVVSLSQQLPVREIDVNWAVTGSAYTGSLSPAVAANFVGGVFPSGTVVFPPSSANPESSQAITITAAGNVPPQTTLGFAVTLSEPINGTLSSSAAVAYGEMYNFAPAPTPTPTGLATLADLWWSATPFFVDLTVESNRRNFISTAGAAQNLGADGSAPFGVTPPVFLSSSGPPATFADNNGRGGAFAVSGGTLTSAGSNPPPSSELIITSKPWSAGAGVLGDYLTGNLYAFNPDTFTDNGTQRRWLRRWRALAQGSPAAKRFAHLIVDMQTGAGVPEGTVAQCMLRWSDDGGATWSDARIVAVGPLGGTKQTVKFNRLGSTRRFGGSDRIFELSSSDPFMLAILDAEVEGA